MADILADALVPTSGPANQEASKEASNYGHFGDMLKARMPYMVKGAGYAGTGNAPLTDPVQITTKAHQAAIDLRSETYRGFRDKSSVVKGLNPQFLGQFGSLRTALTAPSIGDQLTQILGAMPGGADALKSFTAGNLGGFYHAA